MRLRQGILLGLAGLILFVAGFGVRALLVDDTSAIPASSGDAKKYPLLAKRLFVENPNDPLIDFAPLRQQLRQYFADNKLDGSLYFEYLPTGTSIRIDGDEEQLAASLIKLPAAMDLYKAAEAGKLSLDQKVTLQSSWLDAAYGELYKKGAGYELTLREAAEIMLRDSDNTALKAIASVTANSLSAEQRAISAVDADIVQNPDLSVSIGARSYTSFLKCLYFACYLNHEHSQTILNHLSNTSFNTRLVAGVDNKDITIAHKIGVASLTTQSDCGIIYLPSRNYSLCVMIRGQDNSSTDKHIAQISKTVYDYVKP